MFGSTENFWAWLVFTSIFGLAYWLGLPKRLGASLELQIVVFASLYATLYTLFNAPNAALMWILVAVTVFALTAAHMVVRNCERAVARQPLIGGPALAAVGLTLVLPTPPHWKSNGWQWVYSPFPYSMLESHGREIKNQVYRFYSLEG